MRTALYQAGKLLHREIAIPHASIPVFLCPALLKPRPAARFSSQDVSRPRKAFSTFGHTRTPETAITATSSSANTSPPADTSSLASQPRNRALPVCCPGCGAPTQILASSEAGYYSLSRGAVKSYLDYDESQSKATEDDVFTNAIKQVDDKVLQELGLDKNVLSTPLEKPEPPIPICDRCHNLIHHSTGVPIFHPTIEAIQDTIAESPHKRNHIYHVIDAADFPMSFIPNLNKALRLPQLRTQNRRSKHRTWQSGDRIAEVSFIITRSDLLAPLKEQVDRLMPYMKEVLREALGRTGRNVRLGNVHMVSAKRGWWTKEVKEDIWERGGGGWMVGKVNVGKSNLFEVVFPKARGGQDVNVKKIRSAAEREHRKAERERLEAAATSLEELVRIQSRAAEEERSLAAEDGAEESAQKEEREEVLDDESLLPPARKETPYPAMPTISALPGTTASPIRIPFGNGKGELIDLPGLRRSNLDVYVRPEHKLDLVMKSRIVAKKHSIKPGSSLLLGGLVRITPHTPDLVFLAHPFMPIDAHITSTEKAEGIQNRTRESGVPVITEPWAGEKMQSAGTFQLKWDVTRKQTGPLTGPAAVKLKPERLPFIVYSADILIEGCGWVELVAQVRRPKQSANDALTGLDFPEVEVFSPEGKFIATRPPMGASVLGGPKPKGRNQRHARPRRSMKSAKAQRKPVSKSPQD
ncbi:hypothetical protein AOQ84DRAFT_294281 [Glonium stellatum]|uniref:Genetic interactor of prohibitins 3, mitochondrial n=1 Tax=Glonium stellatum TaxID=574774 RepID=A0A8E2JST5_9PEZI|nr:hypothetical protein AOQ84DRAFT_294281 [Glonium stellatum]